MRAIPDAVRRAADLAFSLVPNHAIAKNFAYSASGFGRYAAKAQRFGRYKSLQMAVIASSGRSLSSYGNRESMENNMIRNPNYESTQFIQSLKGAGVAISNEQEVIERLEEAREWHYAFTTLVKQGQRIGISFLANPGMKSAELQRIFAQYKFAEQAEAAFEANLIH